MHGNRKYIIAGFVLTVIIVLYMNNIYLPLSGTVIDAENGQPLEGAVVLVEWTKTHGIGEHWTESYKVAEVLTDKNGKFSLPGEYNPSVDPPNLTIYKKGYVAWNNELLFPTYKKRTNFSWDRGLLIKLDKFNEGYSHNDHVSFIRTSIGSSMNLMSKKTMYNAFNWEDNLAQHERIQKGLSP